MYTYLKIPVCPQGWWAIIHMFDKFFPGRRQHEINPSALVCVCVCGVVHFWVGGVSLALRR